MKPMINFKLLKMIEGELWMQLSFLAISANWPQSTLKILFRKIKPPSWERNTIFKSVLTKLTATTKLWIRFSKERKKRNKRNIMMRLRSFSELSKPAKRTYKVELIWRILQQSMIYSPDGLMMTMAFKKQKQTKREKIPSLSMVLASRTTSSFIKMWHGPSSGALS